MPDLNSIVQKMIDNNESDEDIDLVVQHFKKLNPPKPAPAPAPVAAPAERVEDDADDTFMEGFSRSLFGGEALSTGLRAIPGFLQGAIADIPETLMSGAKDMLDFKLNPGATAMRMAEGVKQLPGVVSRAGSEPEEFGRLMGQVTGQPAVMGMAGAATRIPGAINRLGPVNRTMSRVGSALETTNPPAGVPVTPRGLINSTVRGVASPIGRGLQRIGERGRLGGSGVETANALAARNPPRPTRPGRPTPSGQADIIPPIVEDPLDLAARKPPAKPGWPPPVDSTADNIPPIVETADDLAGRAPVSRFQEPVEPTTIDPIFQEPPLLEDAGALAARNPERPFRYEPLYPESFDAEPLPPVLEDLNSYAARGGSTNSRFDIPPADVISDVDPMFRTGPSDPPSGFGSSGTSIEPSRFKPGNVTVKQGSELPKSPKTPKPDKPAPPKETFDPSIDPKTFKPEDIELLNSKRTQLDAALEQMLKNENVDLATGEIVDPKRAKNWRMSGTSDDAGVEFAQEVERSIEPDFYDLGNIDETIDLNKVVGDLEEPLPIRRPEIPEGQLTNKQILELSNQRGAEEILARQSRSPASDSAFSPRFRNEFTQDMAMLPDEFAQADIPEPRSPISNRFDERMAPGGVVSDDIDLPEWDETQSFSTAPDEEMGLFMESMRGTANDEGLPRKPIGQPSPLAARLVKDGDVVRQKTKQVGPKGQSWSVKDPSGNHLGDITVTPDDVAKLKSMGGGLENVADNLLAREIYEAKFKDLTRKHGFGEEAHSRIKVEPKSNATKNVESTPVKAKVKEAPAQDPATDFPEGSGMYKVQTEEGVEFPNDTFSGPTEMRQSLFKSAIDDDSQSNKPPTKVIADPEEAFAPGGDVTPIREAAARLDRTAGGDLKFKPLLPKSMRYPLGEGESFKSRLSALLEASKDIDDPSLNLARQRMAEADRFADSVPIQAEYVSDLPKLELRDLKPKDFKTPLDNRLRGLIGRERKPQTPWTSPKPKRKPAGS